MTASITGTWRLIATTSHDADGHVLPPPYGPTPMGLLTLTEGGRMMAVLCDGRPDLPGDASREYVSYGGFYRFDGAVLVTRVDVSSAARIAVGGEQVRNVQLPDGADGRMVLIPPPLLVHGVTHHRTLTWQRLSTQAA